MTKMTKGMLTKEKTYAAAKKLFYEKGYINTTVKDICAEANIKLGTFTYHFESKDSLAIDIYKEFSSAIISDVYTILEHQTDPYTDAFMRDITSYRVYYTAIHSNQHAKRFYSEICSIEAFRSVNYKMNRQFISSILNLAAEDHELFYPVTEFNLPVITSLVSGMEIRFVYDLFNHKFEDPDEEYLIDFFLFSYYSMFVKSREDLKQKINLSRVLSQNINLQITPDFKVTYS
ncbi:MAG: TetR/AcrR family transcriptional regulator [Clostridia bacterium]|nr:TetR/AcrR family transcriptional regulator [Clostridia bacterium]